jgi:uncharacterized protein (TIGR03437 family)
LRHLCSTLFTGLALTTLTFAQPKIDNGQVTNAASYAIPELPGGSLARGGMIVIKGSNLGPNDLQLINAFPLPLQLGGTAVRATVNGVAKDLYLIYTSAKQVAAILPSDTPEGTGTIAVTYNGQTSATAPIRVVRSSFGIFTLNQAGSGPGVFQNANTATDLPINTLTSGARPGQLVVIWGTGLGPVTENEATAPRPGDMPVDAEVYIGGKRATVTYKGRSGCCAGIDQIVFTVPDGVEGCYVPVVVKTGDAVSNFVTMTVSRNPNTCPTNTGEAATQLELAQRNGVLRTGDISLSRTVMKMNVPGAGAFEMKNDAGSGTFTRFNYDQLLRAQNLGGFSTSTFGSCVVARIRDIEQLDLNLDPGVTLDAGPVINVNGPNGAKQMKKQSDSYSETFSSGGINIPGMPAGGPDYLEPGEYRIDNGAGGSGTNRVGAFNATLRVPQMLKWENMDAINTVNRGTGLDVTWSGGDPTGYVTITGGAVQGKASASFTCTERTSAGRFNVPAYVLSLLPATSGDTGGSLALMGVTKSVAFTAEGLDSGTVSASSGSFKTVNYR